MIYRNASIDDIEAVARLQQKYHVSTIDEKDKKDGFVTTLFTHEQFKEIIEKENSSLKKTVLFISNDFNFFLDLKSNFEQNKQIYNFIYKFFDLIIQL